MTEIIWVDGGCLGNNEKDKSKRRMYGSFFYTSRIDVTPNGGEASNNVAEYQSLIEALLFADLMRLRGVEFRMDSNLVVNQVNGAWSVKQPHLIPYQKQAEHLLKTVGGKLIKVPREEIFRILGH